jgi:cytochrome c5
MRKTIVRILPVCLLAILAGINLADSAPPTSQSAHDSNVEPAKVVDGVHTIMLPAVANPELPDGPNKNVFEINCVLCHSLRYVTMQPPFSRKTWTAEVEKMKKVYGASIDDARMLEIVDYLISVRGK